MSGSGDRTRHKKRIMDALAKHGELSISDVTREVFPDHNVAEKRSHMSKLCASLEKDGAICSRKDGISKLVRLRSTDACSHDRPNTEGPEDEDRTGLALQESPVHPHGQDQDVHHHGFAHWLGLEGRRRSFAEWFFSSDETKAGPDVSDEDIVDAWLSDDDLVFWLDAADALSDHLLTKNANMSLREARRSVAEMLSYLIPLHKQAPEGSSKLHIEVKEAQRMRGPIQLSLRTHPKLEIDALPAVTLPDGFPVLDGNDVVTEFIAAVARERGLTDEAARSALKRGQAEYRNRFAIRKRLNLSVSDLERPVYVVMKGSIAADEMEVIRSGIEAAVYEIPDAVDSDVIMGAIEKCYMRLLNEDGQ